MAMAKNIEDEILFFINAKQKAKASGNDADYDKRLTVLFAEGQMSEKAYKVLRIIFGYDTKSVIAPPPTPTYRGC